MKYSLKISNHPDSYRDTPTGMIIFNDYTIPLVAGQVVVAKNQ